MVDIFKGLDLIDCLKNYGQRFVQEAVTKITPKKKKLKEANWLFEEALEKSANRRDAKSKEKGKDIFTQLNAEFQRTARRDNNALLNEQCKEIKKNNRMGN